MELVIQRTAQLPTSTPGTLSVDGKHFCFTLEPVLASAPLKPRAIPAGTYAVRPYPSPHFGRTVPLLVNVPDFDDVEVHIGNFPKDTHGCTLVGFSQDELGDVLHSAAAFDALMQLLQQAWQDNAAVTAQYLDAPPKDGSEA